MVANQLNILIIFIAGYTGCVGVNGKTTCVRVNSSSFSFPPANLSCPEGQMIHVQSISYYNDVNTCEKNLSKAQLCGHSLNESSMELTTECNGNRTCNFIVPSRSSCTNSTLVAVVMYRCINSSDVLHICENIITSNIRHTVFLASPNYPEKADFDNRSSPCSCFIKGNITSMQVLELVLKGGVREKVTLAIQYGDTSYNQSSYKTDYNVPLQSSIINDASITLFHHSFPNSKLWIEIKGDSLSVQCTTDTSKFSTPSTKRTIQSTIKERNSAIESVTSSTTSDNRKLVTKTISTTSKIPLSTGALSAIITSTETSLIDNEILPTNAGSTYVIAVPIVVLVLIAVIIIIVCRMKKSKSTKLCQENEEIKTTNTHLLEPSITAKPSHPSIDINSQTDIIVNENTAYVSYDWSSGCNESSHETIEILENMAYVPFEQTNSGN